MLAVGIPKSQSEISPTWRVLSLTNKQLWCVFKVGLQDILLNAALSCSGRMLPRDGNICLKIVFFSYQDSESAIICCLINILHSAPTFWQWGYKINIYSVRRGYNTALPGWMPIMTTCVWLFELNKGWKSLMNTLFLWLVVHNNNYNLTNEHYTHR